MDKYKEEKCSPSWRNLGDTPKQVSPYVRDPHLDLNLETILLSPSRYPLESGVAITPAPLIGSPSGNMRWKALLRGFPYVEVRSTTTCDSRCHE
jgi:hypothetical protein